jgi:hypothetical protein
VLAIGYAYKIRKIAAEDTNGNNVINADVTLVFEEEAQGEGWYKDVLDEIEPGLEFIRHFRMKWSKD